MFERGYELFSSWDAITRIGHSAKLSYTSTCYDIYASSSLRKYRHLGGQQARQVLVPLSGVRSKYIHGSQVGSVTFSEEKIKVHRREPIRQNHPSRHEN